MESGCPVLPKKIKNSEIAIVLDALTNRAEAIAKRLAETDEKMAQSFLKNFEHLKEQGDPMIEWFVASREITDKPKEQKNQAEPDSKEYYSF